MPSSGSAGEPAARERRAAILGLLLVGATALLLRWPVAAIPLERDEGEYAYIAQRWLAGDVPYRDSFDQKAPGVFAAYALVLRFVGSSPAAVHWATQAYTLATLAVIVWLGRRLVSLPDGIAAGLLAALLTVDHGFLGNAANTEQFAILPLAAATATALRAAGPHRLAWSACTGALGAAALLFKPVAAPVLLVHLGLLVGPGRGGWRSAAAFVAGGLAPVVPALGYFAAKGAWTQFWDATVRHNLEYASGTSLRSYGLYFWLQIRASLATLVPVCAAAALAPIFLSSETSDRRRVLGSTGLWLAASLVAVAAGGYFRRHYFILAVPPLALLAGMGLHAAARRIAPPRPAAWLTLAAAAAIVGHAVMQSPWYYLTGTPETKSRRIYDVNPFAESPAVARFLAERSRPEDRIFVFGSEPQLLFYAQRQSASRYIYVYPLMMPFEGARQRQLEALAEIDARPPRLIVGVFLHTSLLEQPETPPDLRRGLEERIARDYRLVAVVPLQASGERPIVKGEAARALWQRAPLWDGRTPWAAFVIWERALAG